MKQTFVLRIEDETRADLELEARRQRQSVAEILRRAAKQYLQNKPAKTTGAEVLLKWATRSEKYPSQFQDKDLSTNYKQYLYGSKSKKFGYLWKKKK